METLTNGLTIFNATPHPITFGCGEGYNDIVVVVPDELVSARPVECEVDRIVSFTARDEVTLATLVRTEFVADETGADVIARAKAAGADVIVGSIIATQAYPGQVLAMVPCPGFERVPPDQKRMRPDRFTTF